MNIQREEKDGMTFVALDGEVDMRTSPDLRKELLGIAKAPGAQVVVNLQDVSYIDSSGIATLIECLKHVSHNKGSLTLVGVNEDIYPVFELAHLQHVFTIRTDAKLD